MSVIEVKALGKFVKNFVVFLYNQGVNKSKLRKRTK